MTKLGKDEILKVATLARLELSEAEIKRFSGELTAILDYVEQLNEVEIEGVEQTSHSLPLKNVLREDVVLPSLPPEDILANAPRQEGNCYKVPAVLHGEGA